MLCGAHSSAKQLKKPAAREKEFCAKTSRTHSQITEQLHMTIFLSDDAWLGNLIFCGAHSSETAPLKIPRSLQADSGDPARDAFTITAAPHDFF
jgi:hypothetical protein